jgi:hypothetical protein
VEVMNLRVTLNSPWSLRRSSGWETLSPAAGRGQVPGVVFCAPAEIAMDNKKVTKMNRIRSFR